MAVFKKTYRPYEGALTPRWRRLLVIPRYAFEDLHRSRFLNIFYRQLPLPARSRRSSFTPYTMPARSSCSTPKAPSG